jgi:hypothetical protein
MNSVKCLLMGSAAGLMAVSAAQAADLPVKAAPVEYVKVCNIYGAGFWYVPGTDTCMKIGTWVRAGFFYNGSDGGIPMGWADGGATAAAGFFNRTSASSANMQLRGLVTIDARTQTEYGTLRSYMDVGAKWQSYGTYPNDALSGGNTTTAENALNNSYNNNNIDNTRAFVQFAGFTAGKARSLFDIVAPGAYSLASVRILADTADSGIFTLAYTAQFSSGISLSLAIEDPGEINSARQRQVVDMSRAYYGGGACATPIAIAGGTTCVGGGGGTFAGGQTVDNESAKFWDPVANLRIDQSWGYAAISGALQNDNGAYYNNAIGSTNAGFANTNAQGHPGDTWGYAGSVGFLLTDFLGLKGDTLAFGASAGHGALGYVIRGLGAYTQVSGNNLATGYTIDGVYANGTKEFLSNEWAVWAGYEHFWTPKLHTAWQGGIVGINYDNGAKQQICAGAPGFAANPNNSLGMALPSSTGAPSGFINGWAPGSQCNPNFGWYELGTRTIWNPHPDIDIGVDVMYAAIQTMNRGATIWQNTPSSGYAPGLYNFANLGQWVGTFRIQRNFLP